MKIPTEDFTFGFLSVSTNTKRNTAGLSASPHLTEKKNERVSLLVHWGRMFVIHIWHIPIFRRCKINSQGLGTLSLKKKRKNLWIFLFRRIFSFFFTFTQFRLSILSLLFWVQLLRHWICSLEPRTGGVAINNYSRTMSVKARGEEKAAAIHHRSFVCTLLWLKGLNKKQWRYHHKSELPELK